MAELARIPDRRPGLGREDLRQGPLARESRRAADLPPARGPAIEIGLRTRAEQIEPDIYECVMTVTVTATSGDRTVFLVEVAQAGIFAVHGATRGDAAADPRDALPGDAVPVRAPGDRERRR